MPRSAAGVYTLPLPPVIADTVILANWANTTMADLSTAMTESLSREGEGGMNAPLRFIDGNEAAPGMAFVSEPGSGLYRATASDVRMAIGGNDRMRWTATAVQIWNGATWDNAVGDAPSDGSYYSRVDATWVVDPAIAQNAADIVVNADQIALNIVNISTNATNIGINAANITAWEAPIDGTPYSRQDAGWVASPGGIDEAPIDGMAYSRKDADWELTPGGADPNDLITAQAFDGTTFLSTRASGNFSTILKNFDEVVGTLMVATEFKSDGPIRHLSLVAGTSIDPSNGGRYTLAPGASQDLNFILPTGIDTALGEDYEVEGSVLVKNGAVVTITLKEDGGAVPADQILGTQPTTSGVSYLLSYVIHRSAGDAYQSLYIWSA